MKCNNCGQEVDPFSQFCGSCGAEVPRINENTFVPGSPTAPGPVTGEETVIGGAPSMPSPAPGEETVVPSMGGNDEKTVIGGGAPVPPPPVAEETVYTNNEPAYDTPAAPSYNAPAQPPMAPVRKKKSGGNIWTIGIISCAVAFVLGFAVFWWLGKKYNGNNVKPEKPTPEVLANASADDLHDFMVNFPGDTAVFHAWLPVLRNTALKESHLKDLSKNDLHRLRLLPLANYGMKMTDADDRDYFEHFPWYKGKNDNVDNMLTQIEKDNIALIEKLEQEAEKAEAEKAEAEKAEAEKAKADAEK